MGSTGIRLLLPQHIILRVRIVSSTLCTSFCFRHTRNNASLGQRRVFFIFITPRLNLISHVIILYRYVVRDSLVREKVNYTVRRWRILLCTYIPAMLFRVEFWTRRDFVTGLFRT